MVWTATSFSVKCYGLQFISINNTVNIRLFSSNVFVRFYHLAKYHPIRFYTLTQKFKIFYRNHNVKNVCFSLKNQFQPTLYLPFLLADDGVNKITHSKNQNTLYKVECDAFGFLCSYIGCCVILM